MPWACLKAFGHWREAWIDQSCWLEACNEAAWIESRDVACGDVILIHIASIDVGSCDGIEAAIDPVKKIRACNNCICFAGSRYEILFGTGSI